MYLLPSEQLLKEADVNKGVTLKWRYTLIVCHACFE